MLWDVIVVMLLAHVFLWPASFLCTQVFFNDQRQWYMISLVACVAFGMIGYLAVWMVYRMSGRLSAWESTSRDSHSRIPE